VTRLLLFAFSLTLAAQPALYPIRAGRQFGFINRSGKVVIPPKYDRVEEFRENRAVVYIGSNAGYIDPAGQLVIPAVFSTATPFEQGRAIVSKEGKYSVLDTQGKTVAEVPHRVMGDYSAGLVVVQRARVGSVPSAYGYMDRNGRMAIEPKFMPAGKFPEDGRGLAVACRLGRRRGRPRGRGRGRRAAGSDNSDGGGKRSRHACEQLGMRVICAAASRHDVQGRSDGGGAGSSRCLVCSVRTLDTIHSSCPWYHVFDSYPKLFFFRLVIT
jgi:hypothetical protein